MNDSYFLHSESFLKRLLELEESEEEFAIAEVIKSEGPTALKTGNKIIIKVDGSYEGWIGGFCTKDELIKRAIEVINEEVPRTIQLETCHGGSVLVYVEPGAIKRKILLIGNNSITRALAKHSHLLGYKVILYDELGNMKKDDTIDLIIKNLNEVKITRRTYAIIATMGEGDEKYVETLLNTNIPYIGVVAGKRRANDIFEYLKRRGMNDITRVKSPAGININAKSADEIAISILAEIIMFDSTQIKQKKLEPKESRDPICGMIISESPYFSEVEGKKIYFCSKACKEKFDSDPKKYLYY